MMHIWQLQDAKARFSEVVRCAAVDPQLVTVRGKEEVVVLSKRQYDRLVGAKEGLVSFLSRSPLKGEAEAWGDARDASLTRDVEL